MVESRERRTWVPAVGVPPTEKTDHCFTPFTLQIVGAAARLFEIDLDEPGDPARSDASLPPDDIRTSYEVVDETAAQRLSTSRHLGLCAVTPAIRMFGPARLG